MYLQLSLSETYCYFFVLGKSFGRYENLLLSKC